MFRTHSLGATTILTGITNTSPRTSDPWHSPHVWLTVVFYLWINATVAGSFFLHHEYKSLNFSMGTTTTYVYATVYTVMSVLVCWCYIVALHTHPGCVPSRFHLDNSPPSVRSKKAKPTFQCTTPPLCSVSTSVKMVQPEAHPTHSDAMALQTVDAPVPGLDAQDASRSLLRSNAFRLCTKCRAFKPPRTHHCSVCQTCILQYDHHCPWITHCVGLLNRKFFLQLIVYATILLLLTAIRVDLSVTQYVRHSLATHASHGPVHHRQHSSHTHDQDSAVPPTRVLSKKPLWRRSGIEALLVGNYLIAVILSNLTFLTLVRFTMKHIALALRDRTLVEDLILQKRPYLCHELGNEYRGFKSTWRDVMGSSPVGWFAPIQHIDKHRDPRTFAAESVPHTTPSYQTIE